MCLSRTRKISRERKMERRGSNFGGFPERERVCVWEEEMEREKERKKCHTRKKKRERTCVS